MKKITESEHTSQSMQRKSTLKRYPDLYNFSIYDQDDKKFKIQISPNSTVGELISEVKSEISHNKNIIGLVSRQGNQIIDYTLKIKNYSLSNYQNNSSFLIQRSYQVENQKQMRLNDFEFLKVLGSGISSSVYLVRHRSNGKLYAMKQINKSYFKEYKRIQQVLRERKIMIQMINDLTFTTRLQAAFESQKFLNFVLQYYPGGEMFVHLQRSKLTQDQAKLYVAQMVLTIQKLHQKKIIYRDLKPQNIMIDFDGHARLGDYGLCKINLDHYDLTYSFCGSEEYMAPQIKTDNGYNYSVDFYTLGSIAFQLVNGVPPFYNNQPLYFQQNNTDEFIEFVQRLIQTNMHTRLKSFTEIKKMKWFKNIQWKKIVQKKYQMPFRLDISKNYIGQEFKTQMIDPDIFDQGNFDKLLQFFTYFSPEKGSLAQFYKQRPELSNKFSQFSQKKKKVFLDNSNSKSRQSEKSSKSNKNSQRSSKSLSKDKTSFRKKTTVIPNIYTTVAQKIDKNKNNKKQLHSKSKNKSKKNSVDQQQIRSLKVMKEKTQPEQKLTMHKVKSKQTILPARNAYEQVMDLQHIFSPKKLKSPPKFKSAREI